MVGLSKFLDVEGAFNYVKIVSILNAVDDIGAYTGIKIHLMYSAII